MSTKFVLEDRVQLKTRNLHKVIENQLLWDSQVNLTNYKKAIRELIFWKNNYLVPPIYLIPRVTVRIKRSSSKSALVSPYWPSAAHWPLVATSKNELLTFRY